MYKNLMKMIDKRKQAEGTRQGRTAEFSQRKIAHDMNIPESTFSKKLNCYVNIEKGQRYDFTKNEKRFIHENYFPDKSVAWLFKKFRRST